MIRVRSLGKAFSRERPLFCNFSYTFESGVSYALCAPSGAGKSTLLHIIAGLIPYDTGTIELTCPCGVRHVVGTGASCDTYLRTCMGLLFQDAYLVPDMSAEDNVALKGRILGHTQDYAYQRSRELLDRVGCAHVARAFPHVLSGGERQRVACARALYHGPPYLLADEPTAHLDSATAEGVLATIKTCCARVGTTLLIATHSATCAAWCDVTVRLERCQSVCHAAM